VIFGAGTPSDEIIFEEVDPAIVRQEHQLALVDPAGKAGEA
jgi:hypothetical protein